MGQPPIQRLLVNFSPVEFEIALVGVFPPGTARWWTEEYGWVLWADGWEAIGEARKQGWSSFAVAVAPGRRRQEQTMLWAIGHSFLTPEGSLGIQIEGPVRDHYEIYAGAVTHVRMSILF